jgi:hypothetical protein
MYKRPSVQKLTKEVLTQPSMKKTFSHSKNDSKAIISTNSKSQNQGSLKIQKQSYTKSDMKKQVCSQKWSDPRWNAPAKYFITYDSKRNIKISWPKKVKECNLKRSKSVSSYVPNYTYTVPKVKRNPNIKYVKAEIFKKHEKIRDQQFEDKLSELIGFQNGKLAFHFLYIFCGSKRSFLYFSILSHQFTSSVNPKLCKVFLLTIQKFQ